MIGSHTATAEFYLNQFARRQAPDDRKEKLWVYQRGAAPFPATPHNVGKENGYFAITKPDGSLDESMETVLATLDGNGAEVLRLIGYETFYASTRDVETLFRYIALTFARTNARRGLSAKILGHILNAYKELASDTAWLQEQAHLFEQFSGISTSPEEISVATNRVAERLAKPEHARNGFIQGLLHLAESLFRELQGKPWQVWEAPPSAQFITTDNPVITLRASALAGFTPGWGFRTTGVTTFFAVSPRSCVVIGNNLRVDRHWRRATASDVSSVNKALVMCMDRWAYSDSRSEDTEWLVSQIGGSIEYGVNAFVPEWLNKASEAIKAKVREATNPNRTRIEPQAFREPKRYEAV
ncbi:MAG TPA: DUF4238 domain-containing protein [Terriglobales bacterium]|jgi:hypothetical protein|nr:DUF4238 domain-containing protein [Terriglobales bacterium]